MESEDKSQVLLGYKELLREGQLSRLLEELRNYIEENAVHGNFRDSLDVLFADYDRMMPYFQNGADDPKRAAYYWNYQCQIYSLIQDLQLHEILKTVSTLAASKQRAMKMDIGEIFEKAKAIHTEEIQASKDKGMAFADWLEKYRDIHLSHVDFQRKVFSYFLTMPQWDHAIQSKFEDEIYLADKVTASLMITAVTINVMQVFDIRKLSALFHIYESAQDRDVKERAFVGAMFCLNDKEFLWTEVQQSLVNNCCSDPESLTRILDFQKQIIYLLDTEKDKKEARKDLDFSDIMEKNPKLKKLEVMDWADNEIQENILSPEEEMEIAQRLERNWRKQDEMEKAGTDIYFKGFCLMKKFGFFHSMVNWLTPFYAENPILMPLVKALGDDGALVKDVEHWGPLCNGDSYSFCLVMTQMVRQMPMLKHLVPKKVFAPVNDSVDDPEMRSSWIRRKYMQDLYRFFVVAPMRTGFVSPFTKENSDHIYFFGQSFFDDEIFQKTNMAMCRFLVKRKDYERLRFFINRKMPENRDAYLILSLAHFSMGEYMLAVHEAAQVRSMDGDKKPALQIEAKSYFLMGDYPKALSLYGELLGLTPNKVGVERKMALCLIEMKNYDKALDILYKLDYQSPNKLEIMRPLAWAMIEKGETVKAIDYYRKIMAVATKTNGQVAEDFYNIGICNLMNHDILPALQSLVRYIILFDKTDLQEKIKSDRDLLVRNHVSDCEIMMLTDAVMKKCREQEGDVEESASQE